MTVLFLGLTLKSEKEVAVFQCDLSVLFDSFSLDLQKTHWLHL